MIGNSQQLEFQTKALKPQREMSYLSFNRSKHSSCLFEKPSPLGATAFFPGFISVRREVSGAPMNGSLTRNWCGRVSLISSISKSLSREGD